MSTHDPMSEPDDDVRPDDDIARLHVVCTGNIARSPLGMVMLEHEARRRIGPDAPVWVTSSGLHGLAGEPAVEASRRLAEDRGLVLDHHRAAVLDRDDVLEQDLVLTMTERQRAAVVRAAPRAAKRVFTVRELARLCAALKPVEQQDTVRERVRTVARLAAAARPHVARSREPEDIADPYGRGPEDYERVGAQLDDAVAEIAPQLFGWLEVGGR